MILLEYRKIYWKINVGSKQQKLNFYKQSSNVLGLSWPIGGQWATSGPRLLVTRSVKLFVNELLLTTDSLILFTTKDLRKIVFILSVALHASAIHVALKTYRKRFRGISYVRYKMVQDQN